MVWESQLSVVGFSIIRRLKKRVKYLVPLIHWIVFEYDYTQDHPSKNKPKAFLVELQQIDKKML